jgi:hypothetical protein
MPLPNLTANQIRAWNPACKLHSERTPKQKQMNDRPPNSDQENESMKKLSGLMLDGENVYNWVSRSTASDTSSLG